MKVVPSLARYWSINFIAFGIGMVVAVLITNTLNASVTGAFALGGLLPLAFMSGAALVQLRGTGR